MKKAAIILARLDSKRLPGKALMNFEGKPLIDWPVSVLKNLDDIEVILATSERAIDDDLAVYAKNAGIECYRGDVNDVSGRVLSCAKFYNIDAFARINGDSPFIRKDMLLEAFEISENQDIDLVSNLVPRSFPYGVAVEVVNVNTFEKAYKQMNTFEKEHITSYFYKNIDQFSCSFITQENKNDHDVRLVVDELGDVEVIQTLLRKFKSNFADAEIDDIIFNYRKIVQND